MRYFKSQGFRLLTAASIYCGLHSTGSELKIQQWNYNWDKSHGVHSDLKTDSKLNTTHHHQQQQQSYYKLIIFIRHGQYHVNKKKSEEKVLTDIGWRQAYATGCRLKEMGIKIDRIIHSDLIRARQTTAGVLVGLQNNVDSLFDTPEIVKLVSPDASRLGDSKSCPLPITGNHNNNNNEPKSTPTSVAATTNTATTPVDIRMIESPYSPYVNAKFDCQLSRFLTEGPPPVAPVPSTASSRKRSNDNIHEKEGIRIDNGFQIHLHRQPITSQGLMACNGPEYCPIQCCTKTNSSTTPVYRDSHRRRRGSTNSSSSSSIIVQCNCPCHRIAENQPIETIVFIGHANVFRYWICRLLQLPSEGWLRLSLGHGSISKVVITNDECFVDNSNPAIYADQGDGFSGEMTSKYYGCAVTLCSFGDVGHLPPELLTY
ncbi:unnamed protein product [Trichobilharzia szidati]|nr:unnamed protein product [Trichobilharzia szidati]